MLKCVVRAAGGSMLAVAAMSAPHPVATTDGPRTAGALQGGAPAAVPQVPGEA